MIRGIETAEEIAERRVQELSAEVDRLKKERDEACEELELLRGLIEGEPWAGAVIRRERDKAREDLEDARIALTKIVSNCRFNCNRDSYCGICEIAVNILPRSYTL